MCLTPRIDNCFENIVMLTHMAPPVQCDDKSCCLDLDMIGMNGFLVKPERIHCCRGNSALRHLPLILTWEQTLHRPLQLAEPSIPLSDYRKGKWAGWSDTKLIAGSSNRQLLQWCFQMTVQIISQIYTVPFPAPYICYLVHFQARHTQEHCWAIFCSISTKLPRSLFMAAGFYGLTFSALWSSEGQVW